MHKDNRLSQHGRHSFVVLLHKDSPHLPACLDSLAAQSERSTVILSTGTPSLYQKKISKAYGLRLAVNRQRSVIADDWNFAFKQTKSPYVTLAHQDDIYEPEYARMLCDAMDRHDDSLIGFTDYGEICGDAHIPRNINLMIKRILLLPFFATGRIAWVWLKRLLLSFGSPIPCPAVTYHRAQLSSFSFSRDFSINLDWDAWLRLADVNGAFVRVPRVLMWHRIHARSETSSGIAGKRRQDEDARLFSRALPPVIADMIRSLYSLSYASNKRA
ncbi:MAG: glycosyltransferase [Spirochaetota bacterium]